jgi:Fe2+ transport system protein FeoA
MNKRNINLVDAPPDRELEVLAINAGHMAKRRLISMGIHMEDKLIKYTNSSWGPVLVKNVTLNSAKMAIGKRLASKIMVRYEEA